ncbi:MAG: hypothetical protein ABH808_00660 [Candidatus Kuenenbacteria bacterium]
MLNKKIKIIILGIVILFLLAILVFMLKIQSENKTTKDENSISILKELNKNKITENKIFVNILDELKKNHPEFSVLQLEFYSDTATKKSMMPCEGRDDENNCISAVAFLMRKYTFCSHIEDKKIKLECSNDIFSKIAITEINKCHSLSNGFLKPICLQNLFQVYEQFEDCSGLKIKEAQEICEGVIHYKTAILQNSKKLCNNIKDEFLKIYCSKNVIDKL